MFKRDELLIDCETTSVALTHFTFTEKTEEKGRWDEKERDSLGNGGDGQRVGGIEEIEGFLEEDISRGSG